MTNKINYEIIKSEKDVLNMLDSLLEKRDSEWWTKFYCDKDKSVPFFRNIPDENLISYFNLGLLDGGKSLDIGCGNGRNSMYLAQKGFESYGVDFSETSIKWACETAKENSIKVEFSCESIFDFKDEPESYDFIYDSGCFHHIKPHRRAEYFNTVLKFLKPNGYFAMTCFNEKGGSNISDYDVYREYSMKGGLGFSEYKLKEILEHYFEIIEFREMIQSNNEDIYGIDILWTVLMKNKNIKLAKK